MKAPTTANGSGARNHPESPPLSREPQEETTLMKAVSPRLLRLHQAPAYLGMSRGVFNATVRPYLSEVRIGAQGVAFDRLDLDQWIEDHKRDHRRTSEITRGDSGTRKTTVSEFEKALVLARKTR
jgi:predicted DNA-binding transcriptional regulator AlpA